MPLFGSKRRSSDASQAELVLPPVPTARRGSVGKSVLGPVKEAAVISTLLHEHQRERAHAREQESESESEPEPESSAECEGGAQRSENPGDAIRLSLSVDLGLGPWCETSCEQVIVGSLVGTLSSVAFRIWFDILRTLSEARAKILG